MLRPWLFHPQGAGAPKQPLSGYVHFLNERRENVRGENPDITFSELSKKLAAEWSALPEEEKLKYNEFAKKDKDRLVESGCLDWLNLYMADSIDFAQRSIW